MDPRTDRPEDLSPVYDGGSVTVRVLRALGWGPELLNLGFFRWHGWLNALNLIPSPSRLAATQKALVRETVRVLAPERGERVLDIACGRGYLAYFTAASHPGVALAAIDILPENVQVARTFYGQMRALTYLLGDAQALPFGAAVFDRAVCLEAAFHFSDRAQFLREAQRVLKPGGRLVVVDFLWRDGGRAVMQARSDAGVVMKTWGFRDFWTQQEYTAAAQAAGFSVTALRDWTARVTRPLQGQFDVLAALGRRRWGRMLLCRCHSALKSLTRSEWQELQAAAMAHRAFQSQARYVCWEFRRL